jgi:hypothetical protein
MTLLFSVEIFFIKTSSFKALKLFKELSSLIGKDLGDY